MSPASRCDVCGIPVIGARGRVPLCPAHRSPGCGAASVATPAPFDLAARRKLIAQRARAYALRVASVEHTASVAENDGKYPLPPELDTDALRELLEERATVRPRGVLRSRGVL